MRWSARRRRAGGVLGVLGVDGGAEAGGDDGGAAGEEDGALEGALDGVDAVADGAVVGEGGGEEDELVSADAGEGVGGVEGLAEVVGDLAEDLVAGVVAEGVVDFLEAVEVEQEEGERAVGAAGALEAWVRRSSKRRRLGEAGELVVEGEPLVAGDLLLEHDEDHADGDEGLLHVPDVGGDVGVGGVVDDPGMDEEAECPDEEAGEDGEASGALAGEAVAGS